jgi:hypothetical protein
VSLGNEINNVALEVLNEFGKSITYTLVNKGTYNSALRKVIGSTSETVSLKAVIEDEGRFGREGLVAIGDKKISFAATSLSRAPTVADTITVDGVGYNIVNTTTYFLGEVPVMYVIQARMA